MCNAHGQCLRCLCHLDSLGANGTPPAQIVGSPFQLAPWPQSHQMHPVSRSFLMSSQAKCTTRLSVSSACGSEMLASTSLHLSTSFNILQHQLQELPQIHTDSLTDSLTTSDNSHPILLDELQVLALCLDDVLLPGLGGQVRQGTAESESIPWERGKRGTPNMDLG